MQGNWSYAKNSDDFLKKMKILVKFQKKSPCSQQMCLDFIPTYFRGQV